MDPSLRRFARYSTCVLLFCLAVILWGAYVRATGSGAGCGSHWPLCNGEVIPPEPSVKTLIEYSHRTTSGLALLGVIVLPLWAARLYPPRHQVRRAAWASLILMLTEAGVGAGLVLFELVADNESMARAMFMGVHLTNTLLLVAALTLTTYWAYGMPNFRLERRDPLTPWVVTSAAALILVGMSGAIAALGDTLYPAKSLAEGLRQDLSPSSQILLQLRTLHPLLAVGGACVVLYLVARIRAQKRPQPSRQYANWLNLLILVQVAAGGLNVVLLAPIWMQLLHLLLADLVWIAFILASAASLQVTDDATLTDALAPQSAEGLSHARPVT